MIYLMGASHIAAILDGCRANDSQQHGFNAGRAPAFQCWPLRDGVLPERLRVASTYIAHIAPHWGPAIAQLLPGGRLGIAAGFQSLLMVAESDPSASALFISMRGEEYFHLSAAAVGEPFDFVLPERPDLAPETDRPLVPLAAVRHHLLQDLSPTLLALTAIRKLCPALKLVRIEQPPPASSEDVARWKAGQHKNSHQVETLPSSLRLKLWQLYVRMLDEGTAALNMSVLRVPEAALHGGGLLRGEYMHDAIHCNAAYGALVCRQMACELESTMEVKA